MATGLAYVPPWCCMAGYRAFRGSCLGGITTRLPYAQQHFEPAATDRESRWVVSLCITTRNTKLKRLLRCRLPAPQLHQPHEMQGKHRFLTRTCISNADKLLAVHCRWTVWRRSKMCSWPIQPRVRGSGTHVQAPSPAMRNSPVIQPLDFVPF